MSPQDHRPHLPRQTDSHAGASAGPMAWNAILRSLSVLGALAALILDTYLY
jgi:hypothetical protein